MIELLFNKRKRQAFIKKVMFYGIGGLVVLYIIFIFTKGFIWFLIQTFLYFLMVMGLLIFLKKRGFFKD